MNNSQFNNNENLVQIGDLDDNSPNSITIMSITLAVLKLPWILLISLMLVLIPLAIYLLNINTVYRSEATVMVSVRESNIVDFRSMVQGVRPDVKSEKYYTSILKSSIYRDEVVEKIFNANPHMPKDSVAAIVKLAIGFTTKTTEPGFITLYAKSESREFALTLAEAALDQFKTRSVDLQREDAFHVSTFINDQVQNISVKLEKASEDLQTFVTEKKLLMIGIETGITQELFELESEHNKAKAELEMININIRSYNLQMDALLNKLSETKKAVNEGNGFLGLLS